MAKLTKVQREILTVMASGPEIWEQPTMTLLGAGSLTLHQYGQIGRHSFEALKWHGWIEACFKVASSYTYRITDAGRAALRGPEEE